MARRVLLVCGIVSTIAYFAIDVFGALSYPGYDYAVQTISEMSAVGAPTRFLLAPLYLIYTALLIAFAFGVRASADGRRGVRMAGNLLAGVGMIGLVLAFFPMQMRGNAPAFTDAMHVSLGGANSLLLLFAIGLAASVFGPRFRLYSLATIAVMLVFGAWTFFLAPAVAANAPTPYLGIVERILFAAFLLWIAAFATMLLRTAETGTSRAGPPLPYPEPGGQARACGR